MINLLAKQENFTLMRIDKSLKVNIRKLDRIELFKVQEAIIKNLKGIEYISIELFTNSISQDVSMLLMKDLYSFKKLYSLRAIGIWNNTKKRNKFLISV